MEKTRSGISLRFWRKATHGNASSEFSLSKSISFLPSFYVYQTDGNDDGPGLEWRLSFEWLFLRSNIRVWRSKNPAIYKTDCDGTLVECKHYEGTNRKFGWYFIDQCVNLLFGWKSKNIGLPFVFLEYSRTELLSADRKTVVATMGKGRCAWNDFNEARNAIRQQFPYRYTLKSGEVQEVTASVAVEKMVWRRKWTPFFVKRTSIDVLFSGEVGEGAGSWKGGCIGCGYTMKRGETAEQTLRRMEAERKFSR